VNFIPTDILLPILLTSTVYFFLEKIYYISLFSLDEMDISLNQISDLNTRIIEMDRVRKQLEAEKLSLGSTIEEYREQLHIEITKYNTLHGSVERLRADLEKKLADKEEEFELLR